MEAAARTCHVVAVPYPGRGHINPMLVLSRLLAARGVRVTCVVTEEWLDLLASSPRPLPSEVRLVTIPNVIPSENGRAADFPGFLDAVFTKMRAPFERFLDRLEPPASAIVADSYLPWAVEVGNERGIPVFSLFTMAAGFFSALYHFHRLPLPVVGRVSIEATIEEDEYLEQYIPAITSIKLSDILSIVSAPRLLQRALEAFSWVKKAQCILFTSFYEIEASVIDALRAELPCPVYTIGPSIPYMMLKEENPVRSIPSNAHHLDYFSWLDSQPNSSVLYVSLGSFLSVSPSQLDEIAMGLCASETRFLWVARGESSRMRQMVGDMGLIVPWCDQLRTLCHPSVGGFLTHCGWNSTLEAVFAGVPMLTFPIFWDQPPDSRLIVDEWKVGISLKEKTGEDNIVRREEIAEVVRRLMDLDGTESKELRRRAMELREASLRTMEEGGSSYANLTSFVKSLVNSHGWKNAVQV
ncbi:UDP-glycosyltransferase 87A2-like [Typha angustifolia]|uniref:UDP-glycosyltransferase 87A2-like n=1 Tax=Typha angustifolia TaxID=59011 RepID=UPI003C2FA38D